MNMKKQFASFLLAFACAVLHAEIPEVLHGIWEGKDRYMFIGGNGEFSLILKVYDGWYFDRAAESEGFEEQSTRERNSATGKNPVRIQADFQKISEGGPDGAYEMLMYDGKKLVQKIPLAVSDGKIYLDFLVRRNQVDDFFINGAGVLEGNSLYGYWQGVNSAENIRMDAIKRPESIYSYLVAEDGTYRIRFWNTRMDYDPGLKAAFTDGENIFNIERHILSGGETFTCTSGRSTRIRNVNKFKTLPFDARTDGAGKILCAGEAAFTKCGESSKDELLQIVRSANSRRRPDPPPPFPEGDLDFHWDLIDRLEAGNKIIEDVRKRQAEFGPRGKDRNK